MRRVQPVRPPIQLKPHGVRRSRHALRSSSRERHPDKCERGPHEARNNRAQSVSMVVRSTLRPTRGPDGSCPTPFPSSFAHLHALCTRRGALRPSGTQLGSLGGDAGLHVDGERCATAKRARNNWRSTSRSSRVRYGYALPYGDEETKGELWCFRHSSAHLDPLGQSFAARR